MSFREGYGPGTIVPAGFWNSAIEKEREPLDPAQLPPNTLFLDPTFTETDFFASCAQLLRDLPAPPNSEAGPTSGSRELSLYGNGPQDPEALRFFELTKAIADLTREVEDLNRKNGDLNRKNQALGHSRESRSEANAWEKTEREIAFRQDVLEGDSSQSAELDTLLREKADLSRQNAYLKGALGATAALVVSAALAAFSNPAFFRELCCSEERA